MARMENKVMELRLEAGWETRTAYAAHLGMSARALRRIEVEGCPMTLPVAWRIADDLGVSIDELLGRAVPARQPERGLVYAAALDYAESPTEGNALTLLAALGAGPLGI